MTKDVLDPAYVVALAIALWATAIALGLSTEPRAVVVAAGERWRFARIMAVNLIAVPVVVFVLVRALQVPDGYAIGLILVGAASAGPLSLLVSRMARADLPLAIGLVIALEAGDLLAIPIWSAILLSDTAQPPVGQVVATLFAAILLPLAVGFAGRSRWPVPAPRWSTWLGRLATAALLAVIIIVLVRDLERVLDAWTALVPVASVLVVLAGLAAGWIVGGGDPSSRATSAIVTAVRASAPALAVASSSYGAGSDAAVAIVVFALVSLAIVPVTGALLVPLVTSRDTSSARADIGSA